LTFSVADRCDTSGVGRRGDMGECPPLGDEKNFDPLNQPAICFLLLVPIYKRAQNNTTRMHENPPVERGHPLSTPYPLGLSSPPLI